MFKEDLYYLKYAATSHAVHEASSVFERTTDAILLKRYIYPSKLSNVQESGAYDL